MGITKVIKSLFIVFLSSLLICDYLCADVDNAAQHYLKAIDLMKYPDSKETAARLASIVKNGWQNDDKELEQILENNKQCIDEVLKTNFLENCDFDFGKEYKYEVQRKTPPLEKLRNLNYLIMLEGRLYERQGNFDKAIDLYLSSLTLAYHISQNKTLVSKMVAVAIEELAITPLQSYVNLKATDKKELEKIANYVSSYKEKHFLAKELVEQEKEFFISTVQMISNGLVEMAVKDRAISAQKKDEVKIFAAEFMTQAHELADRYYGNFAKAAESNNPADWQKASNEFMALQKGTDSNMFSDSGKAENILYSTFTGGTTGENRNHREEILKSILVVGIPDFRKAVDRYYVSYNGLKKLQSSVSNR